jgi:hypothetical protein
MTRKKQGITTRKKPTGVRQRQSDAELLQACRTRFDKLGGEGSASPPQAVALCALRGHYQMVSRGSQVPGRQL